MKILVINTVSFAKNGISTAIMNSYRNIKRQTNWEFTFLYHTELDADFKTEIEANFDTCISMPKRKRHVIKYRHKLKKIVKKGIYDVAHIHGNSSLMYIESSILTKKVSKVIVHTHNTERSYPLIDKILKKRFLNSYDIAFSCSKDSGKLLYGENPYTVINNGINVDRFYFDGSKRNDMRKKYNISNEDIVVLKVARFNNQKNYPFSFELAKSFVDLPKYKFFFVGDGPNKKEILEQNKDSINVTLLDPVLDVEKLYSMADILILPSLYEGLPFVLVEAQANGLKCLVSDTITRDVVFSNDIEFLSIKLIDAWKNAILSYAPVDKAISSKENISKIIENGYSLENLTDQIIKKYLE